MPSEPLQVIECLNTLAECYRKEPNDTQVKIFVEVLKPFDAEVIQRAVVKTIESSTWFPSVHELLRLCREIRSQDEAGYQVDPLLADYYALVEKFYQTGECSAAEFEALEEKFRKKDRLNMADQVRERARRLEIIERQMERLEVPAKEPGQVPA